MGKRRKNKAVFLDRDGTINYDTGFVHRIKDFKFLPKAVKALQLLSKSNYKLIIVTSQSGIGRGYYTLKDFHKVNRHMRKRLREKGVTISAVYYCPHLPDEGCKCRKPRTGLIERAKKRFNLDLESSWVVGDKTSDIKLGKNIKARTVLVRTGKQGLDRRYKVKPDFVAEDLLEAAKIIVGLNANKEKK